MQFDACHDWTNASVAIVVQEKITLIKVKPSHYRPVGPRGFWEVKDSRFRDVGT
jgi:hypothetical protein